MWTPENVFKHILSCFTATRLQICATPFKQKCVVVSLLIHWILKKSTRLFDVKTQTSSPKWIVGQKNNIAEKNIQKNMEEDPL